MTRPTTTRKKGAGVVRFDLEEIEIFDTPTYPEELLEILFYSPKDILRFQDERFEEEAAALDLKRQEDAAERKALKAEKKKQRRERLQKRKEARRQKLSQKNSASPTDTATTSATTTTTSRRRTTKAKADVATASGSESEYYTGISTSASDSSSESETTTAAAAALPQELPKPRAGKSPIRRFPSMDLDAQSPCKRRRSFPPTFAAYLLMMEESRSDGEEESHNQHNMAKSPASTGSIHNHKKQHKYRRSARSDLGAAGNLACFDDQPPPFQQPYQNYDLLPHPPMRTQRAQSDTFFIAPTAGAANPSRVMSPTLPRLPALSSIVSSPPPSPTKTTTKSTPATTTAPPPATTTSPASNTSTSASTTSSSKKASVSAAPPPTTTPAPISTTSAAPSVPPTLAPSSSATPVSSTTTPTTIQTTTKESINTTEQPLPVVPTTKMEAAQHAAEENEERILDPDLEAAMEQPLLPRRRRTSTSTVTDEARDNNTNMTTTINTTSTTTGETTTTSVVTTTESQFSLLRRQILRWKISSLVLFGLLILSWIYFSLALVAGSWSLSLLSNPSTSTTAAAATAAGLTPPSRGGAGSFLRGSVAATGTTTDDVGRKDDVVVDYPLKDNLPVMEKNNAAAKPRDFSRRTPAASIPPS